MKKIINNLENLEIFKGCHFQDHNYFCQNSRDFLRKKGNSSFLNSFRANCHHGLVREISNFSHPDFACHLFYPCILTLEREAGFLDYIIIRNTTYQQNIGYSLRIFLNDSRRPIFPPLWTLRIRRL